MNSLKRSPHHHSNNSIKITNSASSDQNSYLRNITEEDIAKDKANKRCDLMISKLDEISNEKNNTECELKQSRQKNAIKAPNELLEEVGF